MANTTPDSISYPVVTDQVAPFEANFATLAQSVQDALTNRFGGTAAKVPGLPAASAAQRNMMYPSPVQGDRVWRSDLQYMEAYYATKTAGNPQGATTAGWYPVGAGTITALMKRTAAAMVASNGTYTNLSANTLWTSDGPDGHMSPGISYNNGFIPSVSGIYRVSNTLSANGAFSAGFQINATSVTNFQTLLAPNVSGTPVNSSSSQLVYVPAGAVVRFFIAGLGASIAIPAGTTVHVNISMEYVGPPR